MAYPEVLASQVTAAASGSTYDITVPGTPGLDQLWVTIVGGDNDSAATMAAVSGNNTWVEMSYGSNGTQGVTVFGSKCRGDGADDGRVSGASKVRFAHSYLIQGWGGTLTAGGTSGDLRVAHGTTNTLNPPNLNMSTSDEYLFIAALRQNANITGAPTNFTSLLVSNYVSVAYLGSARRQVTASSQDPGAFTSSGGASGAHALTIGVRPGSSGLVDPAGFLPFF